KEIHHRVKNNLQIISSLLNLQSRSIQDKQILELLQESKNRVRLMALIHEKLYQSDNLGKISLGDYIQELSNHLLRSYDVNSHRVSMRIEIEDIFLETDTAVSCGLIINELISNALKYAFQGVEAGTISIQAKQMETMRFCMTVSDNGIGLPQDLDVYNTDTLGLQLVTDLTEQLEGELEILRTNGTEFKFTDLLLSR
ncbi:MAG: sensor histidine kinase, partial [Leptolyngbya sp. SIO4C1]|nr:sensor histidine kinase [Leptolyngbya sp. SIO4C1]